MKQENEIKVLLRETAARLQNTLAERCKHLFALYCGLREKWTGRPRPKASAQARIAKRPQIRIHLERVDRLLMNNNWDPDTFMRVQFERFTPPSFPYYPQLYSGAAIKAWQRWIQKTARRTDFRFNDMKQILGSDLFHEHLELAYRRGKRQLDLLNKYRTGAPVDLLTLAIAAPAMFPAVFYLADDQVLEAVRDQTIEAPILTAALAQLDNTPGAWAFLYSVRDQLEKGS